MYPAGLNLKFLQIVLRLSVHLLAGPLLEIHHQRKVTRKKMNEGIERGHGVSFKGGGIFQRV
jgi:hypothetical protein